MHGWTPSQVTPPSKNGRLSLIDLQIQYEENFKTRGSWAAKARKKKQLVTCLMQVPTKHELTESKTSIWTINFELTCNVSQMFEHYFIANFLVNNGSSHLIWFLIALHGYARLWLLPLVTKKVLSKLYSWCCLWRLVGHNPCTDCKATKCTEKCYSNQQTRWAVKKLTNYCIHTVCACMC